MHRLQPLDVGLFSPLSRAYSKEISDYMYKSQGFISMSKRLFYEFFKKAWEASFISQNIEFAWGATGIWPFNPEKTLAICHAPKQPTTPIKKTHVRFAVNTPLSSHAMRQITRNGHLNPRDVYVQALLRGSSKVELFTIRKSRAIRGTQGQEKKASSRQSVESSWRRRQWSSVISPSRIKAARDFAAAKELENELKKKTQRKKKEAAASEKDSRCD